MDINLKQNMTQKITQKMLHYINILQMNHQELTDYIEQFSLDNPFIDICSNIKDSISNVQIDELNNLSVINYETFNYSGTGEYDSFENLSLPHEETLCENLLSQLLGGNYTNEQHEIFFYIANSLDKNGYFPGGISELSGIFNTDKSVLNNCLDIMKKLDPKGVCAKDLSECLQLQLNEESTYAIEKVIINNHLDLLAKNDLRKISKLLNTDIDNVIKAKENILKLNPRPSQGFSERQTLKYIIPDITIVKFKDHFDIVTNDLFQLNINYDYVKYIKNNASDQQLLNYISHRINEINILKDNITKRNTTLLKLAEYILESQKNFFLLGKEYLKPCKMKDASKTIGRSESTVSRTISGKYLQCCHGVFPLGYFFSKSSYTTNQDDNATISSIKSMIKNIIDTENKNKPFSDQKISEILHSQGITISRRTVAQYRDQLSISDCRIRKLY